MPSRSGPPPEGILTGELTGFDQGDREVLYSNIASTALSCDLATRDFSSDNSIRMTLSRQITEDDNGKMMLMWGRYTASSGARRNFSFVFPAFQFHFLRENDATTTNGYEDGIMFAMPGNGTSNIGQATVMFLHVTRGRSGTNDQVRVGFGTANTTDIANWHCEVSLLQTASELY